MSENKNNNQIIETKEFKVLFNLLEKAEQIISIMNLPDSSLEKYNTLKKMTCDILNIDFIPLQKRKKDTNEQNINKENNNNNNETLNLLYMLNTQKLMLIQLIVDYIKNNNSVSQRKNLNHFLGSLTEIYNLSKENFNKKTEEEILQEINIETNKLSEMFTNIDKIFVDNFDNDKQIRINYENELNKLREKYDKDLDDLKMSLGKNSFQKQNIISPENIFNKSNFYLNQMSRLIDESYEKYKHFYKNEINKNYFDYSGINNEEKLKLDFVEKAMNVFFDENLILKKNNFEYDNCIDCHVHKNCCYNEKMNDICSFLPEIQKESDIFHKKFCELMNYIETNIEGNI